MKFLFVFLLLAPAVRASTFVGNGGNSGDLELQIAIKQIRETFKAISLKTNSETPMCVCTGAFMGHPVCDSLKVLTPVQQNYCSEFLRKQSAAMLEFLDDKKETRFTWTHEDIEVQEDHVLRAAEAVANPQTGQITVNQDRFIRMKPYERTFVLTHEILHLLTWEKKKIVDEEQIGPFDRKEGGRQLLNSVAAATVIRSSEEGITQKYGGVLNRSQGHRPWWINLSGFSVTSGEGNSTFAMESTTGIQVGLRYFFWENWGVVLDYRSGKTQKTVLETIQLNETQSATGIGVSYRFFPFKDPLTYLGQSHLIVDGKIETLKTTFSLDESPLSLQDSASSTALTVGCNYYMPIRKGFWYFAGLSYLTHRYKYDKIISSSGPLEVSQNQGLFNTGVSYGF